MRTFVFIILISITSTISGQSLYSPDWIFLGNSKNVGEIYCKAQYHARTNEGFKEWVKFKKKTQILKGVLYKNPELNYLYIFDCENKRIKLCQFVMYNDKNEVVGSIVITDYEQTWEDAVPESVAELMLKKVCPIFNQ
ncbi:MAG: surface-adhesin E family protein [Ferruginibacter sp.]